MSIIITLVIFTVIVVIHEWGHFIAAKKCNVYVEEFAVGMGPKLFGVKKGDTLYTVRILPVGGFCRMSDEDPPDKDKIGFNEANVWQRMLIAAAGPFMNFVLALVILTFMAMATGISTNTVASLIEGYPAQAAGIEAGDRIVKVNGKNVSIRSDLDFYLSQHEGESLDIVLRRNGHNVNVQLVPKLAEDGRYLIGVRTEQKAPLVDIGYNSEAFRGVPKASFFECVRDGCCSMVFLVKITAYGLKEMFTMQVSMDEVSGPIGVTTVVDESYRETIKDGFIYAFLTMINLAALLSANLGVINLVPIPALDGGKIFLYLIETVRRKQLSPEKEGILTFIGFALVMGFGIFIAINDIIKLT